MPGCGLSQRLEPPIQILPVDEVNQLQPVGPQPEQQPVIRTDSLAHDIRRGFEPQRADERCRLARRQPSGHDHGRAGHMTRKARERLLEIFWEFNQPHRVDFRRVLRQQ